MGLGISGRSIWLDFTGFSRGNTVLVMQLICLRNAYCDMQQSINAMIFLKVYRWTRFSDKHLKVTIHTSYDIVCLKIALNTLTSLPGFPSGTKKIGFLKKFYTSIKTCILYTYITHIVIFYICI